MSNDSDLAEPMRVLIQEFQRTVGLVATTKQPSNVLLGTGPKIVRELREGVLGAAQLPARFRMSTERSPSRIPGEKHKPQTSLGFRAQ